MNLPEDTNAEDLRATIREKHQIARERDKLLDLVRSHDRKLAECELRMASLNRKRSGAPSPSEADYIEEFDGVGKWTKRRPAIVGDFWYREDRNSKAAAVEVIVMNRRLYVTLPTHVDPVPVSEVDGDWAVLLVGPPE